MHFMSEIATLKLKRAIALGQIQGDLCICNCSPCKRDIKEKIYNDQNYNIPKLIKTIY